ncbi:uncharacterized protein LOC114949727 isoform X4 [Acropora millepora]|uniref:uncharacterized protein LOC114949727 isoform X4 n=1 Tax=Acropora millepora TaxID=45264 RepID=UPI001CF47D39|nr:uncharacterized protein LOC114949727 isoform X4 [Acropora millepora]
MKRGIIEGNKHEQPAATFRTSDQAVAAGKSGEQGASAILGSGEQLSLKEYGEAYVKLLINSSNLGKEKEEAMENILSQTVQNYVKFNDLSRDDHAQALKSLTELMFDTYNLNLVSVGEDSVVEGSSIPVEIRLRGARAERAFQKAMQTGRKVKVYRGRIMLLGQDRAGKTSLRKSLLGLPFDPERESTVGVEVDEVEKWMPIERKKGEDNIARFIFRGLRGSETLDNDSTAADPNVEEGKTTDQLEEKKDHKEPKLSPDGEENLVDKNELSNELQLNSNLNFTELAARYSQSRPEDDIKSEEVILSLWDFAGQHLYYASHSVFLSARAVYILVYNLNKNLLATAEPCVRQGLSDIRLDNPNDETNLDNLLSWLVSVHNIRSAANENVAHQQTKLSYQRPPVIIVGTNLDQPFEELATTEKRIWYSIIGKEYAKHVITTLFAVDNRTENDEGVRKLRDKIMEVLKGEPYMPEEVPLRWFNFERAVDALVAKQTYFMGLDQLRSVIRLDCHIEDEEEVTTMLNFYHDLGVIVKHGQTVVLQAQWLIDLFKQLITVPPCNEATSLHLNCWKELEEHGILGESPVDHVFSKFSDKGLCKQDILGMMEQHGLIAKFSVDTGENRDEQRYFVPTQLGSSQSKLDEIKLCECDPCPLVLHFLDGFVPHGLFPQLVSKFIHWCSKNGLKKTPQLFRNGASLFIGKSITFTLILICKKRFIKIVLKRRNPSPTMNASNKMAIEVRKFIKRTLDWFSSDLSCLSNLRFELSVVCTHCQKCECKLHKKTSCEQDDCLHLLKVLRWEELICDKNVNEETDPAPGWEKWFEPHSQIKEAKEDVSEAVVAVGKKKELCQPSPEDKKPPQLSFKLKKTGDVPKSIETWSDDHLPIDILLLTAESCDFLSCFSFLDQPFKSYKFGIDYVYFGYIGDARDQEKLKVALVICSKGAAAPGGSLTVVQNAVKVLGPKAVFSVGTCISLGLEKARIGDVVISSRLITTEKFKTPASRRLGSLALDAPNGWKAPLNHPDGWEIKVHCNGDILSQSLREKCQIVNICERYPEAIAIETEGEGVYAAAYDANIEWLIVKGVASYFHQSQSATSEWVSFASAMAASVVAKMLNHPTVFQEWPHYNQNKSHH